MSGSKPKPKPDHVACNDCDLSPICSPVTVGLAKETVIRMMQKLQNKGLIQAKGKQLSICKLDILEAMAGF